MCVPLPLGERVKTKARKTMTERLAQGPPGFGLYVLPRASLLGTWLGTQYVARPCTKGKACKPTGLCDGKEC